MMGLHNSVCGVLRKQNAISRNTRENWAKRQVRFFFTFWLLIYSVCKGIRGTVHQTLGDVVIHEGQRWFISNWAGHTCVSLKEITTDEYKEYVSQRDFSVVSNLSAAWHRYKFHRDFYRGYWLDIDVNKRLYPRAFTGEPFNV